MGITWPGSTYRCYLCPVGHLCSGKSTHVRNVGRRSRTPCNQKLTCTGLTQIALLKGFSEESHDFSQKLQNAVFIDQADSALQVKHDIFRDLFNHVRHTHIRVRPMRVESSAWLNQYGIAVWKRLLQARHRDPAGLQSQQSFVLLLLRSYGEPAVEICGCRRLCGSWDVAQSVVYRLHTGE